MSNRLSALGTHLLAKRGGVNEHKDCMVPE